MGKENPRFKFKSKEAIKSQLMTDGLKFVAYTGGLTAGFSAIHGDTPVAVVGGVMLVGSGLAIYYRNGRNKAR